MKIFILYFIFVTFSAINAFGQNQEILSLKFQNQDNKLELELVSTKAELAAEKLLGKTRLAKIEALERELSNHKNKTIEIEKIITVEKIKFVTVEKENQAKIHECVNKLSLVNNKILDFKKIVIEQEQTIADRNTRNNILTIERDKLLYFIRQTNHKKLCRWLHIGCVKK